MNNLRIAAVQMSSTSDRDKNLDTALTLMEKAVKQGAEIIGLPENFTYAGPETEKIRLARNVDDDPVVSSLKKFAKENKVAIVGGSIPFKTGNRRKVSNTCLVFGTKGNIAARYDKIHLFDVALDDNYTLSESRYIQSGDTVVTVDLFGQRIGLTICYDLRFPELYRALAFKGAKIIFACSAFTLYTGKDHWEALLRARAIENQCYVIAPAQIGQYMPRVQTYGRTMIVDPWGQVITKCQDKEDVIVSDIDMDFLEDLRHRMPCLDHIRKKIFFTSKIYKKQS